MRHVLTTRASIILACLLALSLLAVVACDTGDDRSTTPSTSATADTADTPIGSATSSTSGTEAEVTSTSTFTTRTLLTRTVPEVGFVTEGEGVTIVHDAGLHAMLHRVNTDCDEEDYMVIGQDPAPGTIVSDGSYVYLTIGVYGEGLRPVPDVVGLDVTTAMMTLTEANDFVGQIHNVPTSDISEWGIVLIQAPGPPAWCEPGHTVLLHVGTPTVMTTTTMPPFHFMTTTTMPLFHFMTTTTMPPLH